MDSRPPAAGAVAAAEQARNEAADRRRRGEPSWETNVYELDGGHDVGSVATPSSAVVASAQGGQAVFASYLQALASSGDQGRPSSMLCYPSGTLVALTPDGERHPIDLSESGLKNVKVLRRRFHKELHRTEAMSVMQHFTPPHEAHDLAMFPGQPSGTYVCLPSPAWPDNQDDGATIRHAIAILVADASAPAPPIVDTAVIADQNKSSAKQAGGLAAGGAPLKLAPGDCVALHGLLTAAMNGKRGAVSATAAKSPGRVGVLIDGERKPRAIKVENLVKVLPECTLAELDASPWVTWLTPASVMASLPIDAVWRVGGPTPESRIDTSLDSHTTEWCSAARPPSLTNGSVGIVFTGLFRATGIRVEAVVTAPIANTFVAQFIASKALICRLCDGQAQFPYRTPTENGIITKTEMGVQHTGRMFAATPLRELATLTLVQGIRRFTDGAPSAGQYAYRSVSDDTPRATGEIGRVEMKPGAVARAPVRSRELRCGRASSVPVASSVPLDNLQ